VEAAVAERLLDEANGDAAVVLAMGVERAIRRLAEASEVLQATHARIASGVLTPTIGQMIKVARLLFEQEKAVRDAQGHARLLKEFEGDIAETLKLVKAEVAATEWSTILNRMAEHERLRLHLPPAQSG
jgi:hypothetical protein